MAKKDDRFKEILNQSDLLLADGMSVVWGARWVSVRLPGRVAGPDVMKALCERAPAHGHKIFLLGTSQDNLEKLAHKLKARTPNLDIVGMYSPPMCNQLNENENQKILKLIHDTKPDLLFVGLSAPKQEKWIAENLQRLSVPVCLGVGAAFDFLSGRIPRAPLKMQTIGLEWLYRLWCEPKRLWKRYLLGNAVFLSSLIWELITYKASRLKSVFRS
jgi:N-acetylglucosaminyldiphosphoundecaprenol N-acetyl-beta-D-mannosaminyltransferase